ncbi:hypothetical protein [Geopseudomonas aromaticivorans]
MIDELADQPPESVPSSTTVGGMDSVLMVNQKSCGRLLEAAFYSPQDSNQKNFKPVLPKGERAATGCLSL